MTNPTSEPLAPGTKRFKIGRVENAPIADERVRQRLKELVDEWHPVMARKGNLSTELADAVADGMVTDELIEEYRQARAKDRELMDEMIRVSGGTE